MIPSETIPALKKYALRYLDAHLAKCYTYHNSRHTEEVFRAATVLGKAEKLSADRMGLLQIAAIFHDFGYLKSEHNNEALAEPYIFQFGAPYGLTAREARKVAALICETAFPYRPESQLGKLLCDADIAYIGGESFPEISSLFRQELALQGTTFDDEQWYKLEIGFLEKNTLFSDEARKLWDAGRRKNLAKLRLLAAEHQQRPLVEQQWISGRTRYKIVQKLADGGMGSVCKAKMCGVEGFEKVVAIKTLLPRYAQDKEFVARFVAEAKLVANLVHENIVQIYQLDLAGDEYFFVLEFVDGISLFELIEFHRKIRKRLPVPLAVFIASRVARALAYAHSRRDGTGRALDIVHCDICPHNILINTEGVPKITDFGIAKAQTMQGSEHISGKFAFMSPEQGRKGSVLTFASDIYSLGIVLFYMLGCGYTRDIHADRETLLRQIRDNFIDWSALPDDVPPALRQMLERMLATDPAQRYADTATLAKELEYYIYKDGYGPTIVTLAQYLRELMPGRFLHAEQEAPRPEAHFSEPPHIGKTIRL